MKSFLFKIYLWLLSRLASLYHTKDKNVVVLNGAGRSGSNGYLFAKYLKKNHPDYQVDVIEPWPSSHLPFASWKKMGQARYVITTHQPFKIKKSQINLQFWHGIPLKRMGIMAHNTRYCDNQRNQRLWHENADIVTSTSDLYESLMSSCMAIETNKYQKLGFPRLDYLKNPSISKKQLLADLFKTEDENAKLGIYMPTFRYELEDKSIMEKIKAGNFLAFEDFDLEKLNAALKEAGIYLLVKLHPYEMRLFKNFDQAASNISFLNNDYLFDHQLDLYEMLGNMDLLMTDFSSIYFDFLELDRPLIFVTNFLAQYQKTRGLLLGPYQEIVPGVSVKNEAELITSLKELDQDPAKSKRHYWHKMINQIPDQNYCEKTFNFMTKFR